MRLRRLRHDVTHEPDDGIDPINRFELGEKIRQGLNLMLGDRFECVSHFGSGAIGSSLLSAAGLFAFRHGGLLWSTFDPAE